VTEAIDRRSGEGERRRVRERRRAIPRRQSDVPWITAPRVLLVATHVNARLRYTSLLEEAGYAVYAVADAVEALQAMTRRLPDAVILGPESSGPDSLTIIDALRNDLYTRDVPAVIITGAQIRSSNGSGGNGRVRHSGATVMLSDGAPADSVLAAVDDLTRGTPVERFAKRQLRRSLLTLRPDEWHTGHAGGGLEQMRAVIDRLQPPVLGLDDHGACVAASRGAESLTGYTRAELVRSSVFDGTLGPQLPFAAAWQEHAAGRRASRATTIRDKAGRVVRLEIEIGSLLPNLHALVMAPAPLTDRRIER
jgi:PAS domain S-box-containing protein